MGEENQDWVLKTKREALQEGVGGGRQSCKRIGVPVDHIPSY